MLICIWSYRKNMPVMPHQEIGDPSIKVSLALLCTGSFADTCIHVIETIWILNVETITYIRTTLICEIPGFQGLGVEFRTTTVRKLQCPKCIYLS